MVLSIENVQRISHCHSSRLLLPSLPASCLLLSESPLRAAEPPVHVQLSILLLIYFNPSPDPAPGTSAGDVRWLAAGSVPSRRLRGFSLRWLQAFSLVCYLEPTGCRVDRWRAALATRIKTIGLMAFRFHDPQSRSRVRQVRMLLTHLDWCAEGARSSMGWQRLAFRRLQLLYVFVLGRSTSNASFFID